MAVVIAFVGVRPYWQRKIGVIGQKGIAVCFVDDYEKAREWLIRE